LGCRIRLFLNTIVIISIILQEICHREPSFDNHTRTNFLVFLSFNAPPYPCPRPRPPPSANSRVPAPPSPAPTSPHTRDFPAIPRSCAPPDSWATRGRSKGTNRKASTRSSSPWVCRHSHDRCNSRTKLTVLFVSVPVALRLIGAAYGRLDEARRPYPSHA
jgi:hypothetical protein